MLLYRKQQFNIQLIKLLILLLPLSSLISCSTVLQETAGRVYIKKSHYFKQFNTDSTQYAEFRLNADSETPILEIINGVDTLNFLIDFGNYSEITENAALKLKGELDYDFHRSHRNNAEIAAFQTRYLFLSLSLGDLNFTKIKLNNMEPLKIQGVKLDGVLGIDFLSYFTVVLDDRNKTIQFFQHNDGYKNELNEASFSKTKKHWNQKYALLVKNENFKEWAEIYTNVDKAILMKNNHLKKEIPFNCLSYHLSIHGLPETMNFTNYLITQLSVGNTLMDSVYIMSWPYKSLIGFEYFKNQKIIFDLPQKRIYSDATSLPNLSSAQKLEQELKVSISLLDGQCVITHTSCEIHELNDINPAEICLKINDVDLTKLKSIEDIKPFLGTLNSSCIEPLELTLRRDGLEIIREIQCSSISLLPNNSIEFY